MLPLRPSPLAGDRVRSCPAASVRKLTKRDVEMAENAHEFPLCVVHDLPSCPHLRSLPVLGTAIPVSLPLAEDLRRSAAASVKGARARPGAPPAVEQRSAEARRAAEV